MTLQIIPKKHLQIHRQLDNYLKVIGKHWDTLKTPVVKKIFCSGQ